MVNRSELSAFCSIQRESLVTGENAISVSLDGNASLSPWLRTNRSRSGWLLPPMRAGRHSVAGETDGSSATLRGPVRRSSSGAIDVRQLAVAISRWSGLIVTCASFSASAKVAGETGGPDSGPVPKVGGAPGVAGAADDPLWGSARHATAAASAPIGAVMRNCLRVFIATYRPFGALSIG